MGTSSGTYEANGFVVHNCGSPVIATDWGAFAEHVVHGKTGWRCRTFEQFVWALRHAGDIDPFVCRAWAEANYGLVPIGQRYTEFFEMVLAMNQAGWYEPRPSRVNLDWLKMDYSMFGNQP